MKRLSFALTCLLPLSVFGEVITFQCTSVDTPGIHKFDARGVITVDDFNNAEGVLTVIAQKAQAEQSAQTFSEVRVSGYIRHFNAGEISREPFDQLVLKSSETYIKSLNLLLDYPPSIASRMLSIDNFSYRSNCKTVDTFH